MYSRGNYIADLSEDTAKMVALLQGTKDPEKEELRQKIKDLRQETGELKQEMEQMQREFSAWKSVTKVTSKTRWYQKSGIFSGLLFYTVIAILIFASFLYGGSEGTVRNLFGYSYFTVLTTSMQDVIPKGSLVITKRVDSGVIHTGDDITFLKNTATTVTHRVIEVIENYDGSGERGFRTKGVNNLEPDEDIVYAANVVGKVIFTMPKAGAAIATIGSHLWFLLAVPVLLLLLSFSLQLFFRARREEKEFVETEESTAETTMVSPKQTTETPNQV